MELAKFRTKGVVEHFVVPEGDVTTAEECDIPNRFSLHEGVAAYRVTATPDVHFNACRVEQLTAGHVEDVVKEAVRNLISALGFKTGPDVEGVEVVHMDIKMAIWAEKGWRRHAILKSLFADWLRKAGMAEVEYTISAKRVDQPKSNLPLEISAVVVVRLAGTSVPD